MIIVVVSMNLNTYFVEKLWGESQVDMQFYYADPGDYDEIR